MDLHQITAPLEMWCPSYWLLVGRNCSREYWALVSVVNFMDEFIPKGAVGS
jgi:hypothetical protein